jgi:hypothetical protein
MEGRILDVSLPPLYHWIMERSRGERGLAFLPFVALCILYH